MDLNPYLIIALIGTLLFTIKLALFLYGADSDIDFESAHAFEVLSLQSILATLMGAGWFGLALQNEFAASSLTTLILAISFGVVCGLFSSALMYWLRKLNYIPTTKQPSVDAQGIVYLEIPVQRSGRGKIELVVEGQKKIIDAISDEAKPIASFSEIKVVEVLSAHLVVVQKL